MKQKHKQKLVIISIVLFILFNAPILLVFNDYSVSWGFPVIYIYLFAIWIISILAIFSIFKLFDE
jgi:hypothetical protein